MSAIHAGRDLARWPASSQTTGTTPRHGASSGVRVAAKSGALLGVVHNEVGVVTFPAEPPYAVAVFIRTPDGDADPRHIDAAMGEAAALAVEALRG